MELGDFLMTMLGFLWLRVMEVWVVLPLIGWLRERKAQPSVQEQIDAAVAEAMSRMTTTVRGR